MTDRPILFSGPMIRAILDGRKTQMRRVLKPQPVARVVRPLGVPYRFAFTLCEDGGANYTVYVPSPYAIGDRLWGREQWSGPDVWRDMPPADRARCGSPSAMQVHYWADGDPSCRDDWEKPRPSIHMPRWASRLTLTVTDVRIERVQDISEADAMAEGVEPVLVPPDGGSCPHAEGLRALWDGLNAARNYGWEANPWVTAITFTAERRNIDAEVPA